MICDAGDDDIQYTKRGKDSAEEEQTIKTKEAAWQARGGAHALKWLKIMAEKLEYISVRIRNYQSTPGNLARTAVPPSACRQIQEAAMPPHSTEMHPLHQAIPVHEYCFELTVQWLVRSCDAKPCLPLNYPPSLPPLAPRGSISDSPPPVDADIVLEIQWGSILCSVEHREAS